MLWRHAGEQRSSDPHPDRPLAPLLAPGRLGVETGVQLAGWESLARGERAGDYPVYWVVRDAGSAAV